MSCRHRRHLQRASPPVSPSGLHGNGVPRPQMNELQRSREEPRALGLSGVQAEKLRQEWGCRSGAGEEGGALVFKRLQDPFIPY